MYLLWVSGHLSRHWQKKVCINTNNCDKNTRVSRYFKAENKTKGSSNCMLVEKMFHLVKSQNEFYWQLSSLFQNVLDSSWKFQSIEPAKRIVTISLKVIKKEPNLQKDIQRLKQEWATWIQLDVLKTKWDWLQELLQRMLKAENERNKIILDLNRRIFEKFSRKWVFPAFTL